MTVPVVSVSLSVGAAKAEALSPLSVLTRGYGIAETSSGVIRSVSDVKKEDEMTLRVSDGSILATVREVTKEEKKHGKSGKKL